MMGGTLKVTSKSKMHILPLTCSVLYPSRFLWCELLNFGASRHRAASFLLNIMELDGMHDPVTRDNQQTLLWEVLCGNYFLSTVS